MFSFSVMRAEGLCLIFPVLYFDLCSVWDLRSNQEVGSLPTTNAVTSLELSRDGQMLTACHDKTVTVYDVNS